MPYKGLPEDLVRLISPQEARDYARATGWIRVPNVLGNIAVYSRPEGDGLDQLLVPMDSGMADFGRRMAEVVAKFAHMEDRPAGQVLNDLLMPDADVLRFRIVSSQAEKGLLPLEDGIGMLEGAKRSLLAAACSVITPQKHHPRMSRSEAEQLLRACRLGQTERGSFTVTVACPLRAVESDEPLLEKKPFARRTTSLLVRSARRLVDAIEQDRVSSVLEEEEHQPTISTNLCEALLRMQPPAERSSLVISATWARALPPTIEEIASSAVAMKREYFPIVEDVYQQLRPTEGPTESTFVALVDTLDGEIGDDGRVQGEVRLQVLREDEVLRARADLGPDDYNEAIEAHRTGGAVAFAGALHIGKRLHRITRIRNFRRIQG